MTQELTGSHLLEGIRETVVPTQRYRAAVLTTEDERPAPPGGEALVLIHGNVSCSWFFQPLMQTLPFRTFAVDLRGFGNSEALPVDARRGLDDFADDIRSVVAALGLTRVHLFGWSMGGGVAARVTMQDPNLVASLTLQAPVSPHGFGGTRPDGTLVHADGAGTGGGAANPEFVRRLADNDSGEDSPFSPRQAFRSLYVGPEHGEDPLEDLWVAAMVSTHVAPGNYPGDSTASPHWPGVAPGTSGVLNALAPTQLTWTGLADVTPPPPILWVRGDRDTIVSDASTSDVNHLGQLGLIPGWPGEEDAPSQAMVSQTRSVLDRYAERGGRYTEVCLPGVGHSPHLERLDEVAGALETHLQEAAGD